MSIDEQLAATPEGQKEETNEAREQKLAFIEYFTDPLCSWSWAFEAQWRRLRYECAGLALSYGGVDCGLAQL
jgi:hypothetical protein